MAAETAGQLEMGTIAMAFTTTGDNAADGRRMPFMAGDTGEFAFVGAPIGVQDGGDLGMAFGTIVNGQGHRPFAARGDNCLLFRGPGGEKGPEEKGEEN